MVDVKVRAGVVVTGKIVAVAVEKDEAVVGVDIVWVTGLLAVDIIVVVIISVELEIAKGACSVLGLAVLIRSVVLVLGPIEGVKLVISEEK